MKDGCNVFRTTLLFCLPFDTIGPLNAVSFAHEQSLFFMQIRCWKKTKTYGLVGLGAPLRQGRSLLLPTLPYQQTNRYAVVGMIVACCICLVQRVWCLILIFRSELSLNLRFVQNKFIQSKSISNGNCH